MNVTTVIANILIFSVVGVLSMVLSRWIRLPYTLWLVLLGFGLSFWVEATGWDTGIRAHNFQDLIIFILLPVLIFEAAFSLDAKRLWHYLPNVITLATLGVLVSMVIIAVVLFFGIDHPGFPWVAALLTGVVISATDPVAVVSQLKAMKAPEDLSILIEGESLFNDATAIVLFGIVLGVAGGTQEGSLFGGILEFFRVLGGGVMVGIVAGWIAVRFLPLMTMTPPNLLLLTALLAYGSFYMAEHAFQVSGIMAVLVAGLLFRAQGERFFSALHHDLVTLWGALGFIANMFVFVLLGLVITIGMFEAMWLAMLLAILGMVVARLVAVYLSTWINHVFWGQSMDKRYPPVMIWGGLRGVVTIALVLSLPTDLPYWWTIQSIGFGVVLFTLIVQAPTTSVLIKLLNIRPA